MQTEQTARTCGNCGHSVGTCAECEKPFPLGTAAYCDRPACREVNAPIDCHCGCPVSEDLKGVIGIHGDLYPWEAE